MKGYPAVIDLRVKETPNGAVHLLHQERQTVLSGKAHEPAVKVEEMDAHHSVLALTVFKDPLDGRLKVVILDSATGTFHVWNFADVGTAMEEWGATLLKPAEKAQRFKKAG